MATPSYRDSQAAERTLERLRDLSGADLPDVLHRAIANSPDPDLALTNLERWLRATGSPTLYLEQISGLPSLGALLITLFGASQPLADSLIQNPELSSLVLEPGQLRPVPNRERIEEDGERLLKAATSYSHVLDRLRFLRQRWNLPIVINDLSGAWEQEDVWGALSDLADGLIGLARRAAWEDLKRQREIPEDCPVLVVAFGKLGGRELNYSSDVDLVYVHPDGLSEKLERDCTRFCEALGRAISDRMGRGYLYRVDLRLRPYGAAGPIVRSMRSVESYYNLYAEPWEVQALLRSRPIAGPTELMERWGAMRERTCFRPKLSEIALEQMLSMRDRIEEGAEADDLKRGRGGIRDVEFLTQVHQLLHGHAFPNLRVLRTCDAIRSLEADGFLEHPVAVALIHGYTFLRKLEHRTQLVGDQQTHSLPAEQGARERLAKSMGLSGWTDLASTLDRHRRTIQTLYRTSLNLEVTANGDRDKVAASLSPYGSAALQWFDLLPERDAFYALLLQNRDSLARVERILREAPSLVELFKSSVSLTEQLLSGEIEEPTDEAERVLRLGLQSPVGQVATAYRLAIGTLLARWTLHPDFDLGNECTRCADELIDHCQRRLYATFDIVATGSYGSHEIGPGSDLDLIFLVRDRDRQPEAEQQAQHFLALIAQLRRLGAPVELDLRLRPEGGKGLLVRTYEGFRAYDLDGMEMWERFALGHARQISGSPEALDVVEHSAYALPLSAENLHELVRMKRRVETERVNPQHIHRNVKLGYGGLNDIEWTVHLQEMRHPECANERMSTRIPDRIRNLSRHGVINSLEADQLLLAHRYLFDLRTRIHLQGWSDDLMPENPDKLDRLALASGLQDGNELLAKHREITETVRRLYLETLERLKS